MCIPPDPALPHLQQPPLRTEFNVTKKIDNVQLFLKLPLKCCEE